MIKLIEINSVWSIGKTGGFILNFEGEKAQKNTLFRKDVVKVSNNEKENAFAKAYLARAKNAISKEKSLSRSLRGGFIGFGKAVDDEIDEMILGIKNLKGFNVSERENASKN